MVILLLSIMENQNYKETENRSGKILAGLIIVIIGSLLLVNNIAFGLPNWLFYWSNILIVLGLVIGAKTNFKNGNGIILIIVGLFFTLKKALGNVVDFDKVGWPALIIAIGLYLILKPKSDFKKCKPKKNKWNDDFGSNDPSNNANAVNSDYGMDPDRLTNHLDYLDSVNVFGGSHQIVYSKNFKGGEITAVFGGCDVNLSQADFEGQIIIDVTAIFGGAKIIVPPGWHVKSEVTAIFGGLDDKRGMQPAIDGQQKLLIIRGIALFGGVDIRNF